MPGLMAMRAEYASSRPLLGGGSRLAPYAAFKRRS